MKVWRTRLEADGRNAWCQFGRRRWIFPESVALPKRRNVSVVSGPITFLFQRDNGYTERCGLFYRHPVVTCLKKHWHTALLTALLTDFHRPPCILTTQYIGSLHCSPFKPSSHVRWYPAFEAKCCILELSILGGPFVTLSGTIQRHSRSNNKTASFPRSPLVHARKASKLTLKGTTRNQIAE